MYYDFQSNLENWMEHDSRNYFERTNSNLYITNQAIDPNKLHFAIVGNPKITNYNEKDSIDPINVINPNIGATTVIWQSGNSNGIIAKEETSGTYEYNKKNNTYDVKNRKQIYDVDTSVPNIKLTSNFLWTGDNGKSCGFNYSPPNGTILILGMKDTYQPIMLGTVPSNPATLYPVLKSGEVSMSGYGNNFIHCGQSDKITLFCGSKAGEIDLDDPDAPIDKANAKKNVSDCELEIIINSNDRMISINAWEKPGNVTDDYNKCNKDARLPNGEQKTKIIISPDNIEIISNDTDGNETYLFQSSTEIIRRTKYAEGQNEEIINREGITVNTDFKYIINAKNINLNADEEINMSSDTYNIEVINDMNTAVNNYKLDTKDTYQIESTNSILASKEETNIFSDNNMSIRTPGIGNYQRDTISEGTIDIVVEHVPDDDDPDHEDHDKDYRIDINGCNVKMSNNNVNHGPIVSGDDVG